MKKTLFKIMMLSGLALSMARVHAESTVLGKIDWGAMTYTATGGITFDQQLTNRTSSLSTYCCVETVHGDGLSYTRPGQSVTLTNTANALSSSIWNDGATGLVSYQLQQSTLTLNGAGTLTFNVPYELAWTNDGGYVPAIAMGLGITPTMQHMYSSLESWNPGASSSTGMFSFTLSSPGGTRNYDVQAYMQVKAGVIPEPETYMMLGAGLFAVALARRKQLQRGKPAIAP